MDDFKERQAEGARAAANMAARQVLRIDSQAARDVLAERKRQIEVEGWTPEHDDQHGDDSMVIAAACYALTGTHVQKRSLSLKQLWRWTGWSDMWFKPKDRRSDLIRAAALILAEIERMDRASAIPQATGCSPQEPT